ncbi:hypothetical protein EV426DRAFT_579098 [Tirmania nivea]|nr:hypothetical protein EV426DRAFT_579098 [Tirmania nivea]
MAIRFRTNYSEKKNKRKDIVSIYSDSEYKDIGNGTPNDKASESDEVVLPFLSLLDLINLIYESWEIAQDKEKSYLWRTKEYEMLLYKLDYQTKEKVEKKVLIDYKYEIAALYDEKIDLRIRIGEFDKKTEVELNSVEKQQLTTTREENSKIEVEKDSFESVTLIILFGY